MCPQKRAFSAEHVCVYVYVLFCSFLFSLKILFCVPPETPLHLTPAALYVCVCTSTENNVGVRVKHEHAGYRDRHTRQIHSFCLQPRHPGEAARARRRGVGPRQVWLQGRWLTPGRDPATEALHERRQQ